MHIFEREVNGHRYRIAAQSVWDAQRGRSVARQIVLGPVDPPRVADLSATQTVGTRSVGDVGALIWVAEQLDLVGQIDRACGGVGAKGGPSVGELVVAVAIQRACAPGPKRELGEFLDASLPRLSCLPGSAFTGQAYHRVAQQVTNEQLEQAQVAIAKAAVARFGLSADVLAFDTTNFDTHIDTQTPGELARRGHAKSKRRDLRVVGLGLLVSETGHVPLLYRTYPGNGSDQAVLAACLTGLAQLHEALDSAEGRERRAQRTVVRDGGFWSPQLELDLDAAGYYSLISLPLGHKAAEEALQMAAQRGAMKPLSGKLGDVRAARMRTTVGELDRTLVVVESQELLAGQKRGIAVALRKAKAELSTLQGLVEKGRITRSRLELRVKKALAREHLASFVVTTIAGSESAPTLHWHVDDALRRTLERTRLGRRVLCTDRHNWSTGRIVHAFRGQWNVEELFRRAKKGGVVPWGPSHQWADGSLRLHTFATVLGLMLVSLAKIALHTEASARRMMEALAEIRVTLVRTKTGATGRRPTAMLAPELTAEQRRAVKVFELQRWAPTLFHV
ncbi:MULTISPECIES: IS1634 family transposase [Paraburkholderia]|uniref:IS1634 family transposase n=2 Tax=Burkholderiaceae TaxID=119060 RepID=UPI0022519361|nr:MULTISPECIES: transposase [Paraburkholderia]MCX4176945.1 transposase [Paraburkholderia madseniana]MDQ6464936.1 transposase [Paraburkholderia madseniana]